MATVPKSWRSWIAPGFAISMIFGVAACGNAENGSTARLLDPTVEHSSSVIFASIFGGAALIALFAGAVILGISRAEAASKSGPKWYGAVRNMLIVLLGSLAGWAIAVAFSPFDESDATRIYSVSQALTVFASGYLLSKFDRFLEQSLFGQNANTERWVLLALFIGGLLAAFLLTFTNRLYGAGSESDVPSLIAPAHRGAIITVGTTVLTISEDGRLSANGQSMGVAGAGAEIRVYEERRKVYVAGELRNPGHPYPKWPPSTAPASRAGTAVNQSRKVSSTAAEAAQNEAAAASHNSM
ncbi:hypothetical protein [Sphingomonas sp. DBB INV C78]|uniref:hypothetical protein n=1 Tax=Sphingomonas sp. DBB INV C78 TaxID=3349434 RepID=UPI0036D41FBF